jgi:putative transposase
MTHHQLGYEKHAPRGRNTGNSCNVKSTKTMKASTANSRLTCRDRDYSFEPRLIRKGQTRFDGFDKRSSPITPAG